MADMVINNLTDTWNDPGIEKVGIKLNVTDTASAAGSKLLELQVDGITKLSIDKNTGDITIEDMPDLVAIFQAALE